MYISINYCRNYSHFTYLENIFIILAVFWAFSLNFVFAQTASSVSLIVSTSIWHIERPLSSSLDRLQASNGLGMFWRRVQLTLVDCPRDRKVQRFSLSINTLYTLLLGAYVRLYGFPRTLGYLRPLTDESSRR